MLTKLLTRSSLFSLFLVLFFLPITHVVAQDTIRQKKADTLLLTSTRTDSIAADSVHKDSIVKKTARKNVLEDKVDYAAKDSLRFEIKKQKVFLFQEADIKYQDINLKAGYVEIDFPKNLVYATSLKDTSGVDVGFPEFIQGSQTFKSKEINYNYTTKRGYINTVFTKQDEGYLHGTIVKKMENDVTYIKSGSYTTCDREKDPHFAFKFSKGKSIPNKKVITGPAYMEIANVATPLAIPFGYFPTRSGQRSGILLPTYGEAANNRGFYFENFGYYWAMSQYMDLTIQADIYTRGSWAIKPTFRYNKRYHYNGSFNFSYAVNLIGAQDSPDFQKSKDFQIRWVHTQDSKARPRSNFSANVNIVSNTFNKYNLASSTQSYLSNTFQSSVNYSTNFAGKYFLNLNFNHSQNTGTKTINVTLPQLSFSVNQFYPFRRQNPVGKIRWYEQISMKYNLDMENRYNTADSNFMKGQWLDSLQNGMRHSIPITATVRVLKYFNWSNSINITDRMYMKTIRKEYVDTVFIGTDTIPGYYQTSPVSGFSNAFDFSLSSSINTRLYGMYQFKKGLIKAIRHMVTPSVSFAFTPNWGSSSLGYWQYIYNDPSTTPRRYSIYENSIYGGPVGQKSGMISFAISNNLEVKVRNRKDTVNGFRKIALIDDLTIRTSYDIARDSLNWQPITISGRSTIIKGLTIQYSSIWDIYARDSLGNRINTTEWKAHHRLLRLDNTSWDVGLTYTLSSEKAKSKKTTTRGTPQERQDIIDYYDYYVDFDIPWSFSVNYSFRYSKTWNSGTLSRTQQIIQTLSFNGQLNITPKWKISLTTGWDFVNNELSYTSIDVYRDLHCWEMRFGWIPKGGQQSWNFSINVKASILQDLKLNKKKDFRDYAS
ncbi:MAG: LPS-assembly protein LptD [Bacteroidales bacterium]|nr:LPS-assembly protein LptD [Bacteroidales bacterium]